jgi:hypothetical protein
VIEVANDLRIDVKLQIDGVTQTVQVAAAASMMQTEDQSISQVIDRQRPFDLPLNDNVTGFAKARTRRMICSLPDPAAQNGRLPRASSRLVGRGCPAALISSESRNAPGTVIRATVCFFGGKLRPLR